jgi:hypothetical protein
MENRGLIFSPIKHFLSFFQKERTCAKKEKRKKRGLKEKKFFW